MGSRGGGFKQRGHVPLQDGRHAFAHESRARGRLKRNYKCFYLQYVVVHNYTFSSHGETMQPIRTHDYSHFHPKNLNKNRERRRARVLYAIHRRSSSSGMNLH